MKKFSKLKIVVGLAYLLMVTLVVVSFFYYGINSFLDLDFLKNNKDKIFNFRDENFILISIVYFLSSVIWVFLLGFATPLIIIAGFAFGAIWGSVLSVISFAVGASLLYTFANHFFKESVHEHLASKFLSLKNHFNENEFSYFFFIRVIPGIPFAVKNIMPVLFDMKLKNFFFATLLGELVPTAIAVSIIAGFAEVIENSEKLNLNAFYSPKIYLPLIGLGLMVLITNYLKKKYFRK